MITFDQKVKRLAVLSERVQGFLDDGYETMFDYHYKDMVCYKLRHRNGNVIFLKLDILNGKLTQCTNGQLTHTETVC